MRTVGAVGLEETACQAILGAAACVEETERYAGHGKDAASAAAPAAPLRVVGTHTGLGSGHAWTRAGHTTCTEVCVPRANRRAASVGLGVSALCQAGVSDVGDVPEHYDSICGPSSEK